MRSSSLKKGFTLIEIIVAVSIFVIVMLISMMALLSSINANRKAQNMSRVIGNLNLAIETMVRDIRTGYDYTSCDVISGLITNCIEIVDKDKKAVQYSLISSGGNSFINKNYVSVDLSSEGRITGVEVVLTKVEFTILGDGVNDGPERVLIHIQGHTGQGDTQSEFNIETFAVSRFLDTSEF